MIAEALRESVWANGPQKCLRHLRPPGRLCPACFQDLQVELVELRFTNERDESVETASGRKVRVAELVEQAQAASCGLCCRLKLLLDPIGES